MPFENADTIEVNISPFITSEGSEALPKISDEDRRHMVDLLWLLNDKEAQDLASLPEVISEAEEFMRSYAAKLKGQIKKMVPGVGVRITHTLGVFGGTMEPSFKVEIDLWGQAFAEVNHALAGFAEEYDQVEYHASVVFDRLPEGREPNVLNPETRTAFVTNVAIRYGAPLTDEVAADLHEIVATHATKNEILGYTIIHPDGYDFYMIPEEEGRSHANEQAFQQSLLELNTRLARALPADISPTYQSNYRYLYIARRGRDYGVEPQLASA